MVLYPTPLAHLPGNLLSFNLGCDLLLNSFLPIIQDHFLALALIVSLYNFNNNCLRTAGKTLKFNDWPLGASCRCHQHTIALFFLFHFVLTINVE